MGVWFWEYFGQRSISIFVYSHKAGPTCTCAFSATLWNQRDAPFWARNVSHVLSQGNHHLLFLETATHSIPPVFQGPEGILALIFAPRKLSENHEPWGLALQYFTAALASRCPMIIWWEGNRWSAQQQGLYIKLMETINQTKNRIPLRKRSAAVPWHMLK